MNQQIRRCGAMLLISEHWLASKECLKELTVATHEKKSVMA